MASGYVRPVKIDTVSKKYELELTNLEAKIILENKISNWFSELRSGGSYNFLNALLNDNLEDMNTIMTEIAESNFSHFDTKNSIKNDRKEAESFYHGFVLGLLINLKDHYTITSNRESGFGRYDICMYPKNSTDHGIVIEFKSIDKNHENDLEKTCINALKQIKEKKYISDLIEHKVTKNNIYVYGFAFQGKNVLIRGGADEKLDWENILSNMQKQNTY